MVETSLKKKGGERGLGDEIRRRLQVSQPQDGPTRLLLDLIGKIAVRVPLDERPEPWWVNGFARETLKAAINTLLSDLGSTFQESSEPPPETMAKLQARYGPDAKPENIGPVVARAVLVENATEALRRGPGN